MQIRVEVLQALLSTLPSKKLSLQARIAKKLRIYNIFHIFLLKQNTTRKKRVNKNNIQLEFDTGNKKGYKFEEIRNSAVYTRESKDFQTTLYHLILWKTILSKKTLESLLC